VGQFRLSVGFGAAPLAFLRAGFNWPVLVGSGRMVSETRGREFTPATSPSPALGRVILSVNLQSRACLHPNRVPLAARPRPLAPCALPWPYHRKGQITKKGRAVTDIEASRWPQSVAQLPRKARKAFCDHSACRIRAILFSQRAVAGRFPSRFRGGDREHLTGAIFLLCPETQHTAPPPCSCRISAGGCGTRPTREILVRARSRPDGGAA